MKQNEIKAEFVRKGIKLKTVADQLGVKAPAISAVLSGARRNPRIRAAIAEAIGLAVEDIWPAAPVPPMLEVSENQTNEV